MDFWGVLMKLASGHSVATRFTHGLLILVFILCLGACGGSNDQENVESRASSQKNNVSLSVEQFDLPSIQISSMTAPGETKAYVRIDGGPKQEMPIDANGAEAKLKLDSLSTGEHYIEVIYEYHAEAFDPVSIAIASKTVDLEQGSNLLVIEQSDYSINELDDDGDGVSNYAELSLPQASNPKQKDNFPPVFSTNPNVTYVENTTTPIQITASDLNGHALTYAIKEGADQDLFTLNVASGELRFLSSPDYEQPLDENADNAYELSVEAIDEEGASSLLAIKIEVTDVASEKLSQALSFETAYPDVMFLGGMASLQVVAQGEGEISFESSDDSIVLIDSNGNMKATAYGGVAITVNIEADAMYEAASASFSVDVVRNTLTVDAWIGADGSDVSISSELEGIEFYRSSDPECDLENYATCEESGMDVVDGNEIVDTAARLEQEGFYTFKWRDKSVQTTIELEFPVLARHQMVVFNDRLWIIGGNGPGGQKSDVWSSSDGHSWVRVTAEPGFSAREYHRVVVYQNKLWLIGGYTSSGRENDVWSSPDGKHWTRVTVEAGFSPRAEHQVVVFQNKLWLIGGRDENGYKNDVWSSEDGVIWIPEKTAAFFSARGGHRVVAFQDRLCLIGGEDDSGLKDDVWWSEDGVNWSTREVTSSRFSARTKHQLIVHNDKLWVVGGGQAGGKAKDIWTSEDGDTWNLVNDSLGSNTRYSHQVAVFKDKLWMSGGFDFTKDDLWSSSDGINWVSELEAPSEIYTIRDGHQAVEFKDKLWLIGGRGVSDYTNDVWSSIDGVYWYQETSNAGFTPRLWHQVVEYQNKLWLIGGRTRSSFKNDIWSSVDGVNWKQEVSSAEFSARARHQVVEFQSQLWLIGGADGAGHNNEVWNSTDAIHWTLVNETPEFPARSSHQVVSFGGKLWLIGGFASNYENDIWSSNDGVNWSPVSESAPFSPRMAHQVAVHDDKLWISGGHTWEAIKDVWSSEDGKVWKQEFEGIGPSKRGDHQMLEYHGVLYVIGGHYGIHKNDVWRFKDSTTWQRAYHKTIQFPE